MIRARHWLYLAIGVWAALLTQVAYGQMTRNEIDALRQRGRAEGWSFTVGENEGTRRPHDELCGLAVPPDWRAGAPFGTDAPTRDLPTYFNWCDLGGCTPVKNQAGCGACWAFGTVGPLESNILLNDGVTVDLAEQWLLSCNVDEMTCAGGWFCHDYHLAKGDACGDSGAVFESDFSYAATELPCNCPYTHHYWIDDWAYVPGGDIPSVAAIKEAIVNHGPVAVAICTPPAFHAYTSGVYNDCADPGDLNHAVVLVGWDDNLGTAGAWRLRNSWGPGWGEGGYMWIEYGCISVGYGANYVVYPGAVWVDFAYTGSELGSFTEPYNTLAEGVSAVPSGGHLRVKAGVTSGAATITKAMTIHAYGGAVTIGG
jgi:hypothetical protein